MGLLDYLIIFIVSILAIKATIYSLKHKNKCCNDCTKCNKKCSKN